MKPGDWIVYRSWGINVGLVDKATPKLVKLGKTPGIWGGKQVDRAKVIAALPTREAAEQMKQSVDGVEGEFNRRRAAADKDRNERVAAARAKADRKIAELVAASGIEARSDETAKQAQPEGREPGPQSGDAQNG